MSSGETFWFHQEARALASLDHPAIVRGRDFGVLEDGSPYLVMDLIAGRSLWSLMEVGQVPWPITWALVDQVLARQLLLPLAFDRGQRLSENLRRRRPEAATPLAVKVHRRAVQA